MNPEPIAQEKPAEPRTELARLTYRYECMRAPLLGFVEASWITFGLLIAIRVFEAPDGWKAAISCAGFFGLLLNSLSLAFSSRTGLRATSVVALYMTVTGLCLLVAAFAVNLAMFLTAFLLANVVFTQQPSHMITVYSRNYAPRERGHRLSTVMLIAAAGGMAFSFLSGKVLDWRLGLWPAIVGFMGAACLLNALIVRQVPSEPITREQSGNPFRNLSLFWEDKLFGAMLTAWMLLGFGNLMMIPLRVEYLANPEYGINASNETVALLTLVLPSLIRMASTKVWGALFDRMHFIPWRLCVNACFLISILIFFNTTSLAWLAIASIIEGLGRGGGMIAWNLWVTKVAPPDKISAYMSVHTAFTGIRGTAAPFVGFYLIQHADPSQTSIFAAALIGISFLIFLAVRRHPRFNDTAITG